MAKPSATIEQIWSDFQTLSASSRDQFLERLVADETVRQEIEKVLDLAVVADRLHEPARSLDDVIADLGT